MVIKYNLTTVIKAQPAFAAFDASLWIGQFGSPSVAVVIAGLTAMLKAVGDLKLAVLAILPVSSVVLFIVGRP